MNKSNNCYLSLKTRLTRTQVVTYDGCFVENTGGDMNSQSGMFNVSVAGIYQMSFTAKYVSSNLV